ncbi:topoisomerase II, partial [Tateyamaria sp.]|nr:topoisomerase II [Tateyamaria sp.]
ATTLQENYELLKSSKSAQKYFMLFLKRSFLRHYDELARKRPTVGDAEVWIGQNNADYGLLVCPRFRNGEWENDKSEIRHFPELYWTIGHILKTGLVVQGDKDPMCFDTIDDYLNFFRKVLVRPSGSSYEKEIAKHYSEFVLAQPDPMKVPLLIPEYRYIGRDKKHRYRLDFCIINPITLDRVGFELSPWSTHGKLVATKGKTQKKINEEALANFEKEMDKHRAYFQKHKVFTMIYTDSKLKDTADIFNEMQVYLTLSPEIKQLEFDLMANFF